MKKPIQFLTILTLSLTLLTTSAAIATTHNQNSSIILYVKSSNYDQYTNLYISQTLDENGELYVIQSHDNISNHWLDATINQSYEITDYKIMD